MELGELEASPDLQHSPQITLEPDESDSGHEEKTGQMKAVDITSPDRCCGCEMAVSVNTV